MNAELGKPEFLRLVFSDLLGHLRSIEVGIDQLDDVLENAPLLHPNPGTHQQHFYYVEFMRPLENHIRETHETF